MAVRLRKLLKELNIGMSTMNDILKVLGYKEEFMTPNMSLPEDTEQTVRMLFSDKCDLFKAIWHEDRENLNVEQKQDDAQSYLFWDKPTELSKSESFWIEELVVEATGKVSRIELGEFVKASGQPLYSVLIGVNGVGKSMLMKDLVDFLIDLHACKNNENTKLIRGIRNLRGVKYHVDGVVYEVARLEKSYIAKINGVFKQLSELRLPSVVACHFGAFDKFPMQTVNGSTRTKYDVPYYKYVGAHVNGSVISSSAIAFRLLFALNEITSDEQQANIRSLLDFIGYDHQIFLQYSFVMKSKKDGAARETISQHVDNDREYQHLSKQEKNEKASQLYNFYKLKSSSGSPKNDYVVNFDIKKSSVESVNELQYIYKLKQYDLVKQPVVSFHKRGDEISSEGMSSGEFAMLATVLSIVAAANAPHTLVLLDEPELSLHPNWQMTLIDNLDKALKNQVCHLIIATHSHMVVSDLPMNRSCVTQLENDRDGLLRATTIKESTYGWSAEEVLMKVFKTVTDRNRYFGERIGKLLEQMANNTIIPKDVETELEEMQEISLHLSDVDPMKAILNTIVETYKR